MQKMSKRVVEIRHVGKKDNSEEQLKRKQELAVTKNTIETVHTVQVEDQEEYVKDQAEMSVTEFNVKINAHEGVNEGLW